MEPPMQQPVADDKPLVLLADPIIREFQPELSACFRLLPLAEADASAKASARALLTVDLPAVSSDVIYSLPALELVVTACVGVDHVDLAACRRSGIRVTNAGAAYSADAADFALGLVVAVLRRVAAADGYVRRGGWAVHGDYPLATKPPSSAPYKFYPTVLDLAANSDVLVLCCALTEQTHHMINHGVLQALGSKGVLVNVGRGGLVDEPELVRCLRDGVIAGAGLDVYENEPDVPPELFGMDNVVLSNHRAVLTPESIQGVLHLVVGNLEAFFAGRPLLSPGTL